MKRRITASTNPVVVTAAEDTDTRLDDAISALKDDFDYAISGLEKMGREGPNSTNDALAIAENLNNSLQQILASIAATVGNNANEG